ncbi:hypothetical protein ES332_A12G082600v1 [Gossypium tomentosum]|uniref:Uncharacterized protein n=1 Tax=Gossypium tomentosum TaxID=34277 RepID=A0A5D2MU05_GOSTO|nr:hypothetical protein ES332_A12G082600v1 [Gossypium tomentosum]
MKKRRRNIHKIFYIILSCLSIDSQMGLSKIG